MTQWFNVGKIVNTHGIKGEVRVISQTDFAEERYKSGNILYLGLPGKKDLVELIVRNHRRHKQFDLLTFDGYDNVNQVEPFKGGILKVHQDQLSELQEGEYYYHEIIGCKVFSDLGEEIGVVKEVLSPGANDVWVVQRKHDKDALIPYIDEIVKEVDVEQKIIVIHIMEGLL